MSGKSKLIVLRGPSGSGKSTISRELAKRSSRPTLVVGEDRIRKMFSDHHLTPHKVGDQLALGAITLGLKYGYDVIYQGILNVKSGEFQPDELLGRHPKETYFFYLNCGFEETVKRHETRHKKDQFKADAMKRWWDYSSPINHPLETIIPETTSLEETIATISKIAGLELRGKYSLS